MSSSIKPSTAKKMRRSKASLKHESKSAKKTTKRSKKKTKKKKKKKKAESEEIAEAKRLQSRIAWNVETCKAPKNYTFQKALKILHPDLCDAGYQQVHKTNVTFGDMKQRLKKKKNGGIVSFRGYEKFDICKKPKLKKDHLQKILDKKIKTFRDAMMEILGSYLHGSADCVDTILAYHGPFKNKIRVYLDMMPFFEDIVRNKWRRALYNKALTEYKRKFIELDALTMEHDTDMTLKEVGGVWTKFTDDVCGKLELENIEFDSVNEKHFETALFKIAQSRKDGVAVVFGVRADDKNNKKNVKIWFTKYYLEKLAEFKPLEVHLIGIHQKRLSMNDGGPPANRFDPDRTTFRGQGTDNRYYDNRRRVSRGYNSGDSAWSDYGS